MCGIAGKVYADPAQQVGEEMLRSMCRAIAHRGPDDEGVYRAGPVGLGMRRLKVIDLEGGHQPMSNEEGTVWIVFNGEIYNYLQLRRELEGQGHAFRTHSDTETILHLYEEQGVKCLGALRGMFAFALWDQRRQTLMLARDRLGKKPLYYAHSAQGLLFGSEIRALLQDPALGRDLDFLALDQYLSCLFVPCPRTIYQAVRKLPPASYALYAAGKMEIESYWTPPLQARGARAGEEEYLEELEQVLREAVQLRMIADVPLGAFLSGGLDSSLVVALMSQLSSRPVETFSLGFKEESFNELSYARLVAERLGTHHREYTVDWDLKELLPPLLEHFGEPFADSSALPQYYLSRATRSEVTVALSGDGADEIFGGYRRYQGRWLAERYNRWPGWAGRWALDWVGAALPEPATYYGFSRRKKLKRFLEYARAVREDESVSWEFFFTAAEKTALYTENFADIIDTARQGDRGEAEPEPASSDPLARMFRKDLRQYLPEDILTKVDRMSMACSLEVRSPFLDHRVVEFAASLPIDMKLRRLQRKYLLRRLGVKLLPEPIAKRPKQGFVVPLVAWFRTALKDWTRDILLSSEALNRGFFRRGAVEEMLRLHEQQRDLSQQLWALLVLELWLQRAAR